MRAVLARLRGERPEGGNAIVEFCYLAILFLIPLVYIMLAVFDVQAAAYGVSAATREAGRAFTLADNEGSAVARARQAADFALQDQGLSIGEVSFSYTCPPAGGCLEPDSSVVVTITRQVPLPFIPDALGGPLASVPVTSTHTTPFGRYRAGR